jgi:hypothetical protein
VAFYSTASILQSFAAVIAEMSVSLRVKNSSGATLSIDVDLDGSVGNLKKKIAEAFKVLIPFNILTGYPPTICSLSDDALIQGNFTANEVLRIQCTELVSSEQEIPAVQKKSSRPSKKPAAVTSSSSNDRIVMNSGSSSSSNNNNKCTTPSFGSRIMTLSGPARTKSPSSSVASKRNNLGPPVTIATRKPRRSAGIRSKESSGDGKEDICSALMSAAEGGVGGRSKALRSVFRSAVAHQYDDSLAVSRLRAAFAGRYSFEESLDIRVLGTGASSKMNVTFPLKPESQRSAMHTESVDMLSAELLRAVLLAALEDDGGEGSREFLKPVNMSKASPRIFWSLIKAYGSDISSALSQLFPQVNYWHVWTHLLTKSYM